MKARHVSDPWFRAQALSWVARFAKTDVVAIAAEAAKAAVVGKDTYQQTAVRAWEIAALAERAYVSEARKSLCELLPAAKLVEPAASRSEALLLLLQAGAKITEEDAEAVYQIMKASCEPESHWRCRRALRHGAQMIAAELEARPFFW